MCSHPPQFPGLLINAAPKTDNGFEPKTVIDIMFLQQVHCYGTRYAERVTMPFASYPKIVHMKRHHAGTETEHWGRELVWEYSDWRLRINTVAQWGAFHYGRGWR